MARVDNKLSRFDVTLTVKRPSGQTILDIDLSEIHLPTWCLALCLLKENLVEAVVLAGSKEVRITQGDPKELSARATLDLTSEPMELIVSPTELDYWLSFFLKYCRDGLAEVDHLDLGEAEVLPRRKEAAYVTLRVKDAREPVPSEEAKKILGIS